MPTADQLIVFIVLIATLVLFVWDRWRYDLVSLGALVAVAIAGLVPVSEIFTGFGHPAVVTVAAVLVLSRGLLNAGVVKMISRSLSRVGDRPTLQVLTMTGLVTLCSGFMNNVGALALLMPVAIWMSRKSGRSPSFMLMPIAFGSLMGGMMTLIGTPPNIIIASFRAETGLSPFGMFDFAPVGIGVAVVGVLFISFFGWRLTPRRESQSSAEDLFHIKDYISELQVPESSKMVGKTLHDLPEVMGGEAEAVVMGVVRGCCPIPIPSEYLIVKEEDILLVETDADGLSALTENAGMVLAESKDNEEGLLKAEEVSLVEAIIAADSPLVGKTAAWLNLRERRGINLLAVARQGRRIEGRIGHVPLVVGDILLLQGRDETLQNALPTLGCLPLAERGLRLGRPRKIVPALGLFAAALAATAFHLVPVQVAFVAAALLMILVGIISLDEAYGSIDWPIIVLLGAMIPIGHALETTGGALWIAERLLALTHGFSAATAVTILLVATLLLSNVVNNAAAAVLMAPIAITFAKGIGAHPDPFLMAVAVGASCAFLTPVGHQSNTLVMAPGGYRFGDYWRVGLPLSIVVTAAAVPLILLFWPIHGPVS